MRLGLTNTIAARGTPVGGDGLALDLQFAADKTLTARKGPTPVFTRASSGTFVGSNGLIQSAGNNVARFDHDPVTLASRGLLIEESRTNLLLRSELLNNTTSWSNLGIATTSTQTAPDGANTALLFTEDTANSSHTFFGAFGNNRPTPGNVACLFSVFIKAGSRRYVLVSAVTGGNFVGMMVDTQNWTITDAKAVGTGYIYTSSRLVDYGNGWYRAELAFTPPAASTVSCGVAGSSLSTIGITSYPTYLGNSSTFIAWGAQLETGSFATSYIPTTTASVVRSADVCSISGAAFSGFWNASEGSLFTSAIFNAPVAYGTGQLLVDVNDGTTANRLRYFRNPTTGLSGFANTSAGSANVTITSVSAIQPSVTQKYSAGFKLDDYAFYVNNSQIGTDNLGAMLVSPTTLTIGDASVGSPRQYTNGTISAIRYYRKRLANAKLQALTA